MSTDLAAMGGTGTGDTGAERAAVKLARAVLASSRAHAFPVDWIAMAPFPFDPAALDGPPRRPLQADTLKADLERAIEGLLAPLPDVTP